MTAATRHHALEKTWLRRAEIDAGAASFAAHAIARLDAGASVYGERWAELGVERLITELAEEAADLGAWGVLALQALELKQALSAAARAAIASRVHAAILAGGRAHRELERARDELARLLPAPGMPTFMPDLDGRCLNCGRTYSSHADLACRPALDSRGIGPIERELR